MLYPLLSSVVLCVLLHMFVIALCGAAFGVTVREISLGLGPRAFGIGRFTFRALPFGGAVRFKDSREEALDASDMHGALDGRSLLVQIVIGLSGCLALLALAIVALQAEGVQAFLNGFVEIVTGALSPMDKAQALLAQAQQRLAGAPFMAVLGLVAAKLAAFNLLPLPAANGGYVIAMIARGVGIAKFWPQGLTPVLLLVYLAIAISWLWALVVYLVR
jgi:membrane-associated protease RseP (regulator of RpoE activity)